MKNSLFIPITSIVIKATCPINEPRLAAQKNKCVRVSHATPSTKAATRPTFPNTKALKARRSYISVTLTNGRRLKLRNAIRK